MTHAQDLESIAFVFFCAIFCMPGLIFSSFLVVSIVCLQACASRSTRACSLPRPTAAPCIFLPWRGLPLLPHVIRFSKGRSGKLRTPFPYSCLHADHYSKDLFLFLSLARCTSRSRGAKAFAYCRLKEPQPSIACFSPDNQYVHIAVAEGLFQRWRLPPVHSSGSKKVRAMCPVRGSDKGTCTNAGFFRRLLHGLL